jgi:hypothetical protein
MGLSSGPGEADLLRTCRIGVANPKARSACESCRRPESHTDRATTSYAQARSTRGGLVEISGVRSSIRNADSCQNRCINISHRHGLSRAGRADGLSGKR